MSELPPGIVATIEVRRGPHSIDDLGEHIFVVLPRVGEHLVIGVGDKEHMLKVRSVNHISDELDTSKQRLKPVQIRSVTLGCDEA